MKRKMMAMTFALILAALIFAFAGCGSKTPSGNPTDNNINKDPYVVSVSNVTPPTKTSYLEGEIFDPTGITFDSVWMIEGQKQTLSLGYGVCQNWSYRNEPLPAGTTKITFEIYGATFDVSITVRELNGSLLINSSTLRSQYSTDEEIDLTKVEVLIAEEGGAYIPLESGYSFYDNGTLIPESEWFSYSADEGEHTFTVKYLTLSETFTVEIVDSTKVITPYHVQAEESIFMYTDETQQTETDDPWSKNENYSHYSVKVSYIENYLQYGASFPETNIYDLQAVYSDKVMQSYAYVARNVPHGAENAAVSNTDDNKNYFYKFDVYVPEDGDYDLFARAQAISSTTNTHVFDINIDGKTDSGSGALIYEECSESATDSTASGGNIVSGSKGYVIEGNQRYIEGTETLDAPSYFNMYYWSTVKIATIRLTAGTHTIRLRPTGNVSMNTDYFALEKAGTSTAASDPLVINERDGSGSVIGEEDAIFIPGGEKLGDISGVPNGPFLHYTLIYLRLYDYTNLSGRSPFYMEVPITEEDISGIDYTKAGKQTATVNFTAPNGKKYTAQFNVIITDSENIGDNDDYVEPYIVSATVNTPPTKTNYIEGEIFDPEGLTFDSVWMVNGKEVHIPIDYTACDNWSHKDEPLTTDVTKITFEMQGEEFDVEITVRALTGSLLIDASSLHDRYSTTEGINLSSVKVYVAEDGDTYTSLNSGYEIYDGDTLVPASEWSSYVAETEGTHTFTVKYLSIQETFTVEVVDQSKIISPYHVQAEDSIYLYNCNIHALETEEAKSNIDLETTNRHTGKEGYSHYVLFDSYITECLNGATYPEEFEDADGNYAYVKKSVSNGAEGAAVSNTQQLENKNQSFFFKFDITVPKDGDYDLFARGLSSGSNSSDLFYINIDGETTGEEKTLRYELCSADAENSTASNGHIVSGREGDILQGNQRYKPGTTELDGTSWFNMYYWSTVKVATIHLAAGTHTIRLRPTSNLSINFDYFALEEAGTSTTDGTPVIINERDGSGSVIGENDAIYIEAGEKLSDITDIPDYDFLSHYTLLYLRIFDYTNGDKSAFYTEVPITEENITGIEYSQTGKQTATVSYTYNSSEGGQKTVEVEFTVIITNPIA